MAGNADIALHIEGFEGFDRSIDFDKREVRKGMRKAGRIVERRAKALVALGGRSAPGRYPARQTGRLQRAIKTKVSRSGFMVKVMPQKIAGMRDFYPAFLYYGARRKPGARRDRRSRGTSSWRIEPRGNYMVDAKDDSAREVRALLVDVYRRALTIR
ncbi:MULTISPECIES: hypothetical protein [Burkholderia]|uniref:hypothetical protein n=1 Tax=Burkholderia TaxID=32008 RepID=UPI00158C2CE8|nr:MULTISPECIES: hypothetical protein [Burkholderia]MDN8075329.1 hypothetical protein [Burkholderia vietnamiensis]HDR8982136.1 hypothetical protein [Burkholderia vietnamiensis]HDR9359401.1 hypothetical protein [Burkholderia vietnamiensis]